MFNIIGKDINSVNLHFLKAVLTKQKEKKETSMDLSFYFSRTALKIVSGPSNLGGIHLCLLMNDPQSLLQSQLAVW